MDKWQGLQSFWSSFGIPAYDENSVDETMQMPYITYEARVDSLGFPVAASATIWMRSNSWAEISQKADEIGVYIDTMLTPLKIEGGYIWIYRGTPFAQRLPEENDEYVRRMYLNIMYEYLTEH